MKTTIYKFVLQPSVNTIQMQKGAQIISVQTQHEQICIWAIVDPSAKTEDRCFEVIGTGHDMHEVLGAERRYLNSVQLQCGVFVFHVFEIIPIIS